MGKYDLTDLTQAQLVARRHIAKKRLRHSDQQVARLLAQLEIAHYHRHEAMLELRAIGRAQRNPFKRCGG